MKKMITVFIVCLFCASALAQQKKEIVQQVEVKNNKVISEQTILSKLKTKLGKEFSANVLNEDVKRLYATGLFNDVSADVTEVEGGVKIIINVKEKPSLKEIIFKGNKRIKSGTLTAKMKIKKKEIFDQFKLKDDIEEIKKFYAEKGYSQAVVDYTTEEKENEVKVTVNVDEGNRIRIRKIVFFGNTAFKQGRLRKLIKTKRRSFFQSGFYKEPVLEEDKERVVSFYHAEGFIDAKVDAVSELDAKKNRMLIIFKVEEGKQYKVEKVGFSGNTIVSADVLKNKLKLAKGVVYSEQKMRDDISTIQSYYFDRGYITALVKVDTALDAQAGTVGVDFNITEGLVAYVDKVNITGNIRTKETVIRREMRLFPGDRYNGEKLKRSRERLYNLDYFEEVTFDTAEKPTTLPDKYDLDVFVKEAKTGEFSFGAGYSSVDKFIGFIDLTQKNFDILKPPKFTGGGQRLRLRTEFGTTRRDYELSFVEPWFLGYPVSMGFDVYNRTRAWEKYDERRVGGDIFLGKNFSEYWYGRLLYRYEGIRIYDVFSDASRDIKVEEGKNYVSSITAEINHDTRDNIYNPTTGMYNKLSCEVAGGFLSGDKDFTRYYSDNRKFIPVSRKAVLELRGRTGMVDSYGSSDEVPIYERFYAGGSGTIRGYKERRVGPEGEYGDAIGGRFMAIFNAEYTYQIAPNFKWAFFYDNGNVWTNFSNVEWGRLKLKSSIGTGLRVKTPLGPIKLDYGYALQPKPGDARGRFHFSMSQEF